jgi:hypothetical protein
MLRIQGFGRVSSLVIFLIFSSLGFNSEQVYAAKAKKKKPVAAAKAVASPAPSATPGTDASVSPTPVDASATAAASPVASPEASATSTASPENSVSSESVSGAAKVEVEKPKTEEQKPEVKKEPREVVAVEIIRAAAGQPKLNSLKLKDKPKFDNKSVTLKGTFAKSDYQLLLNKSEMLQVDPDSKKVEFKVNLLQEMTEFELTAVGPTGEIVREILTAKVQYKQEAPVVEEPVAKAEEEAPVSSDDPEAKLLGIRAGLSLTSISYSQTGSTSFSMIVPTLRGSYSKFIFPDRWNKKVDLGASFYMTTFPITTDLVGSALYFYGVNARAGYHYDIQPDLHLLASGGFYYLGTFGRADTGYVNVVGLQLFGNLTKKFEDKSRIGGYLKFAPVSESLGSLSLGNSEKAFGFEYGLKPASEGFFRDHPISFNADFSWLYLDVGSVVSKTQTIGVGATLPF